MMIDNSAREAIHQENKFVNSIPVHTSAYNIFFPMVLLNVYICILLLINYVRSRSLVAKIEAAKGGDKKGGDKKGGSGAKGGAPTASANLPAVKDAVSFFFYELLLLLLCIVVVDLAE